MSSATPERSRKRGMNPDRLRENKAFNAKWYACIELAPDMFTPGPERKGVAQTRDLLKRADIEAGGSDGGPARCLDLGMQEGLVTTLLARRGVPKVVGYDRAFRKSRLNLVQRALGVEFELLGDVKLQDYPGVLKEAGHDPFDAVVFSGVLYHMFDPLGGLAVVRGMVRDGGLLFVETTIVFEDTSTMHLNSGGRFTPNALWFVTPRSLDYMLRFLHLEPLDVVYLKGKPGREGQPAQGRIAIACRAVPEAVAEGGDEWISSNFYAIDFKEFLDWESVKTDAPPVAYDGSREGLVHREDGGLDVAASVAAMGPLKVERDQTRLRLGDKY